MFDESVANRFWAKVDKSGPTMPHMDTPCWMWTASRKVKGYGQFAIGRRWIVKAHRMAYMLAHGDIAPGLMVCHRCDNPACVRDDHLFLGTNADNMRDAVTKGRLPMIRERVLYREVGTLRGEQNGSAKTTTAAVVLMRQMHAQGKSITALARMFNLSYTTTSKIVNRVAWKHVD